MIKIRKRYRFLTKIQKTVRRVLKMEADRAIVLALDFVHFQVRIRPRLRLVAVITALLALAFVATSAAVNAIKPEAVEVKINGHEILVADSAESASEQPHEEISQAIEPRRSPFEFTMPVDGHLSGGYTRYHRAYDIAAAYGTLIHPVGSGVVEFAGFTADGKGNVVVVDHGDGLKSLYAHMGKIHVGVGNVVSTTSVLGTVGLTGRTTGPHVHFEIYDNGQAVNPANLLP